MSDSSPLPITAQDLDLPAFLNELRKWVDIESPTADADAVNRMVDHVETLAKTAGFAVSRAPGTLGRGDILTVRHGPSPNPDQKGILILAHLDTVHPIGTLTGPLPWKEEGSRIYGPGIYDMKSGALMALEALKLARGCGDGPKCPVTILFVADEETGSRASRATTEAEAKNAFCVLVVEPARDGGKVVTARRGSAIYEIAVKGRAAHAGTNSQKGRSAIRAASKLVLQLEDMNDLANGIGVSVGTITGGTTRNTIPAECRFQLDVRLPDAAATEWVIPQIEALQSTEPDIEVQIEGGLTRPAFARSEAGDQLFSYAADMAQSLGYSLIGMSSGGGSDGNFTGALGIPTLDGLGPDGEGAHTHVECIYPQSVAQRTALLANLMLASPSN
ncbi:M20 family metallopeptidase [Oceaniovalibus sp. ACAM 378]|uniref:M20 family metallopeptidase n=1 Tax=Oceaniovalibus sp. ACAM 378 TaxID=2599923 RepID=UPI0011D4F8FB|nr:M20 family metallopeptidase [Oceaniovalibus sp. ACAM 378]TYB84743.1 M20 family metallopeptidase [Oceaniovalibus sp. ACAM 378]